MVLKKIPVFVKSAHHGRCLAAFLRVESDAIILAKRFSNELLMLGPEGIRLAVSFSFLQMI
jgi:hypothetical protein